MEGTGSQYRRLEDCICCYLYLHPDDSRDLAEHLKERMLELQIQVGAAHVAPLRQSVARSCC
jgi:hypothetical protein